MVKKKGGDIQVQKEFDELSQEMQLKVLRELVDCTKVYIDYYENPHHIEISTNFYIKHNVPQFPTSATLITPMNLGLSNIYSKKRLYLLKYKEFSSKKWELERNNGSEEEIKKFDGKMESEMDRFVKFIYNEYKQKKM